MQPTAPRRHVYDVDAQVTGEYWSHDAVIRIYDNAGNVFETHEQAGDFKEP
jgi:hypothetical protein